MYMQTASAMKGFCHYICMHIAYVYLQTYVYADGKCNEGFQPELTPYDCRPLMPYDRPLLSYDRPLTPYDRRVLTFEIRYCSTGL